MRNILLRTSLSIGLVSYFCLFVFGPKALSGPEPPHSRGFYEGSNFNSGNYLFTTDTK